MLPDLPGLSVSSAVAAYAAALRRAGFTGAIRTDEASRRVAATDNSIYQVLPAAVIEPGSTDDVVIAHHLLREHQSITLAARGAATSTNGQCLTEGVVLDLRRMDRLVQLDVVNRLVTVEPGMILDQLNAALRPHGLKVGPTLSTSSRATIGGMVGTDAAGKGSRRFGKTSCAIDALELVLDDGSRFTSRALSPVELDRAMQGDDRHAALLRQVVAVVDGNRAAFASRLPRLDRFFSGYTLGRVRQDDGRFNLNWLLCGAEGSLATVTAITLRLVPLPAATRLVLIRYDDFTAALADARTLLARDPEAIETIDATVVACARGSAVWQRIAASLPAEALAEDRPWNLVQFTGDDAATAERAAAGLPGIHLTDPQAITAAWDLRKAGVGLLGRLPGARKPVPFVEDTVVPPDRLADYVAAFRALLDAERLRYGMFGHVDVGCLHVRPALDGTDPADVARIRRISDAVERLARQHGGMLWGEHGKGYRAEYLESFLGPQLHQAMRALKAAFDPGNRLNPGKIAVPCGCDAHLPRLDAVPLRGEHDRGIGPGVRSSWSHATACNGNGACHSLESGQVMCPSYQLTRDRRHSPKGRADLVRSWLQRVADAGGAATDDPADAAPFSGEAVDPSGDFSHQVHDALAGCLACKGCSGQCPVQVDVPELKSRFLAHYHRRYRRPLRDHLAASLERLAPLASRVPRLANALMRVLPTPGLVELPAFDRGPWPASVPLSDATVILVGDVFITAFDRPVLHAAVQLLTAHGQRVHVTAPLASGKPLHVLGLRQAWQQTARRWIGQLHRLADTGLPLIGLEPAIVLSARQEAAALAGRMPPFHLLGEWLATQPHTMIEPDPQPYVLLAHCTEQATAPAAAQAWMAAFRAESKSLDLIPVGCCGMAGLWGHQQEHAAASRQLFAQSWAPAIAAAEHRGAIVLADGFSCRHQVQRILGRRIPHPVEVLR